MENYHVTPINEHLIEDFIAHTRQSYSHNLNMYLLLIKTSDPFKRNRKEEQRKGQFHQAGIPIYDEKGKYNWEIIHLFMPQGIEKAIKKEYDTLQENEIRLLCLRLFDVPVKTILNILAYNKKSIYSTTCLVKKKAGVKELWEIFRKIILNSISIEE